MPVIQAVPERKARLVDAFSRDMLIVPLIQAAVERRARLIDAFK